MLEVKVHQQITYDALTESKAILLIPTTGLNHQTQPTFHLLPAPVLIQKTNSVISDNSMFHPDMEFFVDPASGYVTFSKQEQFPA